MSFEFLNSTVQVSKARLKAEVAERKARRESGEETHKDHTAVEAVSSIRDSRAQKQVANIIRKAVNSYDIQGRRITSYYDEMFELASVDTTFINIVEANGIGRTTDFSVSWREESPNNSAAVAFFNANYDLPPQAQATETIRSNTAGTYGNTLLVPWITKELGEQSRLGAYDVLSNQMRQQMIRMKKFRDQTFLVNNEITSEIVGDVPQWNGFYTDSVLNASAAGVSATDLTSALINALHVAIGNPTSIDSLGIHTSLVAFTTPNQMDVVRNLQINRYNAENSSNYLADQARLAKALPGVELDPDQVIFFKTRLGAVIAFCYDPYFTALAAGVTFCFDPNRSRIVKFEMLGQMGPWVIKREIPELVDEFAIFDFESILTPNQSTRGSYTNCN
jgi:hypothetical protein